MHNLWSRYFFFFFLQKKLCINTSGHFMGGQFSLPWSAFVILLFQQAVSLPRAKHPGRTHKDTWLESYTIQKSCSNTSPPPSPSLAHCQRVEPIRVQNLCPPHHIAAADTLACCCWTEGEGCMLEGAGTSDHVQSPQDSAGSRFLILAGISPVS